MCLSIPWNACTNFFVSIPHIKKRLKDCILKYVIFLGWYWNLGFKWKIPVILLCQERRMIVLVVMADVLTGSHFYMWGQSCSKSLISQTFSLPMLLLCFYSITCTITDRWGLLSKDKAGVISPPGLAWHTDRFWELYRNTGFSELNSEKSKISSIKLACPPPQDKRLFIWPCRDLWNWLQTHLFKNLQHLTQPEPLTYTMCTKFLCLTEIKLVIYSPVISWCCTDSAL